MTLRRSTRQRYLYVGIAAMLLTACTSDLHDLPELKAEPEPAAPVVAPVEITQSYVSSPSDAAEEGSSGLVVNNSPDLELTYDAVRGPQLVGLRFEDVQVPRGATVEQAHIQFQADEPDSGQVSVRIQAVATDDAAGFAQGSNHSISERKRTTASALWDIAAWNRRGERNFKQRTPDLKDVLKEVTSREGWRYGHSVAFILTGDNQGHKRVAESYRGDKQGAPVLHIKYSGGEPVPEPAPEPPPEPTPEPRPAPVTRGSQGSSVIMDSDTGTDVDDLAAFAVLHALADEGEADILATVSSVHDPYAAAAIDAINTYYGRSDIPVGRNADPKQLPVVTGWWRKHSPRFVRTLAERFPNDTDIENVPDAVSVYRKVLASQPDSSVTVIAIGFMSNLAALLESEPDRYSPLNGVTLVERKVKELVIMGGTYPRSSRDLNIQGTEKNGITPQEGISVLDHWPTTMTFAAGNVCGGIVTGKNLKRTPESNPVREGFRLYLQSLGQGRPSWDPCTVLYAVRGLSESGTEYFSVDDVNKHLKLDKNGNSKWVGPDNGRHRRLEREISGGEMTELLESLMTAEPKR